MKKPQETSNKTIAVSNVKVSKKGTVFFTLEVNGVYINGCRVVESKKGDFFSFPQYKGTNDKYYNHCFVALTEDEQKEILAAVEKEVNK